MSATPTLELPSRCGVMLLDGTPLFPNCAMDLHIFEHRYRVMLQQTLAGQHWMFALGSLVAPEESPYEDCVAPIGTVALIQNSHTLDDGRSVLVVSGIQAVRFEDWDESSPYPSARITPVVRNPIAPEKEASVRSLIFSHCEELLRDVQPQRSAEILSILRDFTSASALMDNVAHNFVASTELRQELITELDDEVRAAKLITALQTL